MNLSLGSPKKPPNSSCSGFLVDVDANQRRGSLPLCPSYPPVDVDRREKPSVARFKLAKFSAPVLLLQVGEITQLMLRCFVCSPAAASYLCFELLGSLDSRKSLQFSEAMVLKSYSNLLGLASGDTSEFSHRAAKIPRMSPADAEAGHERIILAAHYLPLISERDPATGKWSFTMDEDALLLQMRDGFPAEAEVLYVGCLNAIVDPSERDEVAQELDVEYGCVPVWLEPGIQHKFYHGFCKQYLWPLFHCMFPWSPTLDKLHDADLYQAYVAANNAFAKAIKSSIRAGHDTVWVHDYHLMLVPTLLRKHMGLAKVGFFLHSPFPSSEIYRTLPVREAILRGLLNADVVGFHTFDYARHFLSCCNRLLGLDYELKRGHIVFDYYGRKVTVKILPVGIHMGRLKSLLALPDTREKIKEIKEKYKGKMLILGVDDKDILKGISQKLLGLEQFLKDPQHLRTEVVLVQIANPPRGVGKEVQKARDEVASIAERINLAYGAALGYLPVVLIDKSMPSHEKVAYYAAADCCIVNAFGDGMNLVPYEYTVCRQDSGENDEEETKSTRTSTLIISEFMGCSPSLNGAIRVNPWSIEQVSAALERAARLSLHEKALQHEKHYRYIRSHDVVYWVGSFAQDLQRAWRENCDKKCWHTGLGVELKVIAVPLDFGILDVNGVVSCYKRTHKRLFFLDYDGTIMPKSCVMRAPSEEIISVLNRLCADPENTLFIVSGRGQDTLSEWFSPIDSLGIAAEHGYFLRWSKSSEWESGAALGNFDWKEIVEPIMRSFTEATDGSYVESKKTGLVWHYHDADSSFGSWQARNLAVQLENVLAKEPVVVQKGDGIVEAKPQGIHKGLAVQKVISTLASNGNPPDFILSIGDGRSDEDMFESIEAMASSPLLPAKPQVFLCTVGLKPTKAKYYVEEAVGVAPLLQVLATALAEEEKKKPLPNKFHLKEEQDLGESDDLVSSS
ncbi:hypothetical protein Taro_018385 [Colocasia esculenta]|uniref:Trehalose-phosphatase n=1 Tax=Colocasia esculenta TaxID=4460 RepID=A0A843UQV4_COLES|nr:hypothetical protein [Colocasia esculenta]